MCCVSNANSSKRAKASEPAAVTFIRTTACLQMPITVRERNRGTRVQRSLFVLHLFYDTPVDRGLKMSRRRRRRSLIGDRQPRADHRRSGCHLLWPPRPRAYLKQQASRGYFRAFFYFCSCFTRLIGSRCSVRCSVVNPDQLVFYVKTARGGRVAMLRCCPGWQ